jgi:site-specific DNA-methyltransferase (adenine-specific)
LNTDIRSGNAAGGGHTNAARESGLITAPASDEAKKLDGSYAGYQPKPAVEVVIVAMKPLEKKGYLDQALDNGKGVTWLDDCRIPFAGMNDEEQFDKDNVAGHQKFIEKRKEEMYGGGWDKPARNSKSDTYERVSASKSEKNMGLDKFEVKQKDERTDIGKGSFTEKGLQPGKNVHPTVKPMTLMSYLVTLGSRKNDVVLDPFMGSGTTPMACVTLSRNYIGIEREDEYFKIAEARVNKLENPIKQWEQWI